MGIDFNGWSDRTIENRKLMGKRACAIRVRAFPVPAEEQVPGPRSKEVLHGWKASAGRREFLDGASHAPMTSSALTPE